MTTPGLFSFIWPDMMELVRSPSSYLPPENG